MRKVLALLAALLAAPVCAETTFPVPLATALDVRTVVSGANISADTAALQSAMNALAAGGKALCVPDGVNVSVNATITVAGFVSIGCGGTITLVGVNGPLFVFNISADTIYQDFGPINLVNQASGIGAGYYDQSAGIVIQGAGSAPFHYVTMHDISCVGFMACIKNSMPTFTTANGQESYFAWNRIVNLMTSDGVNPAKYGVQHTAAGGTGNTYFGFKNSGGATGSAAVRFDAGVVGDVIFTNGHLQGVNNVVMSFGSGLAYKSRILISDTQVDAGMTKFVANDNAADSMSNIIVTTNNIGSGVNKGLGLPFLSNSIITEKNVSEWRSRAFITSAATGLQTVTFGSIVQTSGYGMTTIDFDVSGLVSGVGGGGCHVRFLLAVNSSTVTATRVNQDCNPAGLFDLAAVSGGGQQTNFTVAYTPTSATQSSAEIQVRAVGFSFKAAF
ncbi:MAG: hypothetical protein JSS66_19010 [Armatimonadetes bacterium]|nr:hypothetical protein [Armatimonadota bacterium]